jgi:hypothetical protein
MRALAMIAGVALVLVILWDSFETIVLPRRVTRKFRLTRAFYRLTWFPWSAAAARIPPGNRRESFLSYFGPLSLLLLFSIWALAMVLAFGLLHWALGSTLRPNPAPVPFWTDLYMSGTTFFTLGLGDYTPTMWPARVLTVAESGIGFGFLAMVITYLPVLYEAFSRRETDISLLDARAGSPPSAAELLKRHAEIRDPEYLSEYLRKWEIFAAELMESHLSYPVLCFYRSQHSNQSWLSALATILDACGLLMIYAENPLKWQASMTFAISRHALVDLAHVLHTPPVSPGSDRLAAADLGRLLSMVSIVCCQEENTDPQRDEKFSNLRRMYDPYLNALSKRLLMPLPRWIVPEEREDNWQTTAWGGGASAIP